MGSASKTESEILSFTGDDAEHIILNVCSASRQFGRTRVFSGLTFTLTAGRRLMLTGPNGSGKTTLLRCLAGTLALTSIRQRVLLPA